MIFSAYLIDDTYTLNEKPISSESLATMLFVVAGIPVLRVGSYGYFHSYCRDYGAERQETSVNAELRRQGNIAEGQ